MLETNHGIVMEGSGDFSYLFGRTTSGENVDEFKAMQTTAVYACVRILAEAVASLPIHVYERTATGKEKKVEHPLYFLLHDEPNPEMSSFVFRETFDDPPTDMGQCLCPDYPR